MRKHAYDLIAITAIATSAAALAMPAGAQTTTPGMGTGATQGSQEEFSKLDADKDGKVSKKEAAANKELSRNFGELDANRDGRLDQGEFAKFEIRGQQEQPTSPLDRPTQ